MRFGIARELITPSGRRSMAGYGSRMHNKFETIHDDLYAKALFLDDGRRQALFITVDLCEHRYGFTAGIMQYASQKYAVPEDCVFLNYSHTHAGPSINDPVVYDRTPDEYEQFLYGRIVTCIDRCLCSITEGSIHYGSLMGHWSVNRRREKDGVVTMAPNPEGITDDELHLLVIKDKQGEIKGIVVNMACHPVTLGETYHLSSEYPGRLCQLLEAAYYGGTVLFMQGAGGDSRPLVTMEKDYFRRCDFSAVDEMALGIASYVQKAITSCSLVPFELSLASTQFTIPLALEKFTREELQKISGNEKESPSMRSNARELLEKYDTCEEEAALPAGVIRLGKGIYIVFLGGEVCADVKLGIERTLKGRKIIFLGYTNDVIGYIPDESIISQGGYEGDQSQLGYGFSGRYAKGIDDVINTHIAGAVGSLDRQETTLNKEEIPT